MKRPRVVLITGEPGSGKTTLGTELARALRVPFLARDDVRGGLFFTAGAWGDAPRAVPSAEEAVDAFLQIVETISTLGVSCVVEYVVRRERPDDLRRLSAVADCVVLRTACRDAEARFAHRSRRDPLLNRRPVLDLLGHASVDDHTEEAGARMATVRREMQTEFDLPTLTVHTDDGYQPPLDRIISFVTDR